MERPLQAFAGAAIAAALTCGAASAESDLVSRHAFSGLVDVRAAAADGQPSFLQGGFGRTRFGGYPNGDFRGHAVVADVALTWQPQFTWDLGGVLDVEHQPGQQNPVDFVQAYLIFKPTPKGAIRYAAKAGLFYPPISEEHEGPQWSVVNTITPSAINTWVGEEVKVLGGEAKVTAELGGHELSATGGAFGYNDTAGTLLAFRGWGLHDVKATAFSNFRLPPLDPYMAARQPQFTSSTIEMDGRVGYYARLDWRPPGRAGFSAFYYDNNGDKVSLNHQLQWSWETRFWNFGATWDVDDDTRVLSQVLTGEALMGFPNGRSVWINIGYTSAYVLATHSLGRSAVTGRVEYYETSDRNFRPATDPSEDDRGEFGWALTGAYRYQLNPHARIMVEAMHTGSKRPSLKEGGLQPRQRQTVLSSSFRLTF
jgi:hypothetical protein